MNLNLTFVFLLSISLFVCFAKNLSGSAEVEEARGKLKVSSKFVQDVADYVRLVTMIMIIIYISCDNYDDYILNIVIISILSKKLQIMSGNAATSMHISK